MSRPRYQVKILEHKTIHGLQEHINHWLDSSSYVGQPTISLSFSRSNYSHVALIVYQDGS